MNYLVPVQKETDIYPQYANTPICSLLMYHNLKKPMDKYDKAKLIIGMCMDNRKQLCIPDNFAYVIRSGGGNLRYSEFKVSYAIGVGGVTHVVLIGHNKCGMVNLMSKKKDFVNGLVKHAGWDIKQAEEHFMNYVTMFEIDNEMDFVMSEANRLRFRYPKIEVAPLFYKLEDNMLYQFSNDRVL